SAVQPYPGSDVCSSVSVVRALASRLAASRARSHPEAIVSRKLFVNVSVRDLKKSMDFFSTLGFTFNPQFTDDKAACMVVSEEAYFMLLSEPFFRTFTKRQP